MSNQVSRHSAGPASAVAPSTEGSASFTTTGESATFATHWESSAVLVCEGVLDGASTVGLHAALDTVRLTVPDRVIVDLSAVSFFDCCAIGAFVEARNGLRGVGGDLRVRGLSGFERRMLAILGLDDLESLRQAPSGDPLADLIQPRDW